MGTKHTLSLSLGLTNEELQQHVIDAMVESGATIEEVAKAMTRNKLLETIGDSSEKMAQGLLAALRSGEDISKEKLDAILAAGGLSTDTAAKLVMFQRALGNVGADPEDVARAILLQKALSAEGATPENIAKVVREIAGSSGLSEKEIDALVENITSGNLGYDEVMKALKLDKALEDGSTSALPESIQGILSNLSGSVSKEVIKEIADALVKSGSADPETMAKTVALQKVMTELGLKPDEISKFMKLQKSMYDAGASPQDIAQILETIMGEGKKNMNKDEIAELLRERLGTTLSATDVANMMELVDAFQNANIPPELVAQMALLQKSIESALSSPEKSAKSLADQMKKPDANPESLEKPLKELLEKNGVTVDGLEKAVLLQKALLASGVSSDQMSALMELENAMLAAGKSSKEIAEALQEIALGSGADFKAMAQTMVNAMEQGRLKEDDILVSSNILNAVEKAGIKPDVLENIKTLQKALEAAGISPTETAAILAKATGNGLSKNEIENIMTKAMSNPNLSEEEKLQFAKLKQALQLGNMKVSGLSPSQLEQILLLQKALEASGVSKNEINAVIRKATTEGLSDTEIANIMNNAKGSDGLSKAEKANLKLLERNLKAGNLKVNTPDGVSPSVVKNLAMLEKILELSGASPGEIAAVLAKASAGSLSDKEIAQIMNHAKINPSLSAEDKQKLQALESSLRSGELKTPGLSSKSLEQVLLLRKAMEASGASEAEIEATIAKATGQGLSDSEISDIMSKAKSSKGLSREDKAKLKSLESSLKGGSLKVLGSKGIRPDVLEQLSALQKILEVSGFSEAEINSILSKATGQGLSEVEISKMMKNLMNNPKLSKEDKQKLIGIERNLLNGNLKTPGMTQKNVEQIVLLRKALEAGGASETEINALIAKATSVGLSDAETAEIMKKAQNSKSLSKAEKDKLKKLEKELKSGGLRFEGVPGVPPEVMEQISVLQKALEDSGASDLEIAAILAKATSVGLSQDEIAKVMTKIMRNPNLTKEQREKLGDLENCLKSGDMKLDDKARTAVCEMQKSKGKKELVKSLSAALDASGINAQGLAKALLVQKLMEASDCAPEDLAKVCRIENALIKEGAPADVVCRTISAVIEPRNKALLEKLKKPLVDLVNGEAFKVSSGVVDFSTKYQKAMTSNDQNTSEAVKKVFDNALGIAGLSKEDVAKAMLVQKTLAASGVTPEIMAQVVMLQKALAASGASPEEIANILAKAAGEGLSDEAIEDIMAKVMSNENMSKEDIENMMKLQKTLKGGVLKKAGVTPEAMGQICKLQKALEASGATPEQIAKILADATSQNLSDEAVQDLMSKALDNSNIKKDDYKNMSELQKNLKEGNLKAMGLSQDVLENVMFLQKALEKSGASPEEIKRILEKATSRGLDEKEVEDLMNKFMNDPHITKEQREQILNLGKDLKAGKLKTGGVKSETMEQISTLQKALEASGASKEEIASILAKATGEGLSKEEISKVMNKILNNSNLTEAEKEKLIALQENLEAGNLRTSGLTTEKLEQVLLLQKAMEASGASQEEINAAIARATNEGLDDKEINDIMKKAMNSKNLTKEEKEKMKQLQKDLKDGKLKVGGVTGDALEQVMMLQKALEDSGASSEEIKKIMAQAASGNGLSEDILSKVMSKVLETKDVSKEEFDGMVKLEENLKNGKLKTPGISSEVMEQVVLLQKALEATGASPEEIANTIAKATSSGLSDEAISDLMSKVLKNENLSPEEREKMLKLQQNLKDGSLKLGNKAADSIEELMRSGAFDQETLAKALLVQKILANSGMDPDDLGKAVLLQKAMLDAGATPEQIAKAMKSSMLESGMSLDHMLKLMEIELKTSSRISSKDVAGALKFEKVLGAGRAADMILRKMNPEHLKLLETLSKGIDPGNHIEPITLSAVFASMIVHAISQSCNRLQNATDYFFWQETPRG